MFLNAVLALGEILSLNNVRPVSQDVAPALVLSLLTALLQQLDSIKTLLRHLIRNVYQNVLLVQMRQHVLLAQPILSSAQVLAPAL